MIDVKIIWTAIIVRQLLAIKIELWRFYFIISNETLSTLKYSSPCLGRTKSPIKGWKSVFKSVIAIVCLTGWTNLPTSPLHSATKKYVKEPTATNLTHQDLTWSILKTLAKKEWFWRGSFEDNAVNRKPVNAVSQNTHPSVSTGNINISLWTPQTTPKSTL